MKKTVLTLAIASFLVAGMAEAGDWSRPAKGLAPLAAPITGSCLSYDYVDLEYSFDDYGSRFFDNGNSYGLGFSKSLGSLLFINGSIHTGGYDHSWGDNIVDVDTRRYRMGVGVRHEIAECVDLTFEGGFDHMDSEYGRDYSHRDYDSWAYYFGPGIRARAGRFEFFAKALYTDREGDKRQSYLSEESVYLEQAYDGGWVFTPGVILHLNERLGFKVAGEFDGIDSALTLGARFHF
ncbi:hypothetical protein VSU19_02380 [Verrucomicrobiales bacterium BCK34]|nr:hypothetical protein [Verrucomicrobiales bacterium BCK34]